MKKLIITTTLFAFASVSVFAQSSKTSVAAPASTPQGQGMQEQQMTPAQRSSRNAEQQAKFYEKQYKLSPDQYNGIYSACLDAANKMEVIRASNKQPTPKEMEALMADRNAKFKAVMTAEQYKAYDATLSHTVPQPAPTNNAKRN